MEEITAANRGSSNRQKKHYRTAATLISNQHQRKNKQIINNSTYFLPHCWCGWEKHPKKHTSQNTNWPVAFRSFAKKHRSSFTTRSRRRKRSPRGQAPLSPLFPFNLAAMSSRPAALSSLTLKLFRGTDLSLRCSSSRGCWFFCCCCWVDRTQNQVEISSAPLSH